MTTRAISAFSERTSPKLHKADVTPNPLYRYTTPSHMGKRAMGDRRKHGCIEEPRDRWCFKPEGKTKSGKAPGDKCFHSEEEAVEKADGKPVRYKPEMRFTGKRCLSGKPDASCRDKAYDAFCQGSSVDPCASPRATCPVQLVWVDGRPNLRFCKERGKPGYLVKVKNVAEAMQISKEACDKWPYKLGTVERADGSEQDAGWDPEFFNRNAPQVLSRSRADYPEREGLGGFIEPRGPSPRKGNPAWLAAGVAMGVMAAVLLKKRASA